MDSSIEEREPATGLTTQARSAPAPRLQTGAEDGEDGEEGDGDQEQASVAALLEDLEPADRRPAAVARPVRGALEGGQAGVEPPRSGQGTQRTLARVFPADVVAVVVAEDGEDGGGTRVFPPAPHERRASSRLAAALRGTGGPIDALYDGIEASAIEMAAGRGVAFGLTAASDDLGVQLLGQMVAAAYATYGRTVAAAGRTAADHYKVGESARALADHARAMRSLFGLVRHGIEAVELERARERRRSSIPRFVVTRVDGGEHGAEE